MMVVEGWRSEVAMESPVTRPGAFASSGFFPARRCSEAATISPPSSMRDAVAYVTGSSFLSFLSFNSLPKGNTPISEFTQRG